MEKTAVDAAAKKYWEELYGEYGAALVRDIPRRIKAALLENKKIASVEDDAGIHPVASARHNDGLLLEGLYDGHDVKLLFRATVDKVGNVTDVQAIEVR